MERRKAWRTGLVLNVWYEGEGVPKETHISDLSVTGAYIAGPGLGVAALHVLLDVRGRQVR